MLVGLCLGAAFGGLRHRHFAIQVFGAASLRRSSSVSFVIMSNVTDWPLLPTTCSVDIGHARGGNTGLYAMVRVTARSPFAASTSMVTCHWSMCLQGAASIDTCCFANMSWSTAWQELGITVSSSAPLQTSSLHPRCWCRGLRLCEVCRSVCHP
jgi:hypothetical protein